MEIKLVELIQKYLNTEADENTNTNLFQNLSK